MSSRHSIRYRLFLAAIIVIAIALQVAGAALFVLFDRNLYRQMDLELEADIEQLAGRLDVDQSGTTRIAGELADPRFLQQFSGRYWQIADASGIVLRSRSLWDERLDVRQRPAPRSGAQRISLTGPSGQVLYGMVRAIVLEAESPSAPGHEFVLAVAMDEAEIKKLKSDFRTDAGNALAGLAVLLLVASWLQVAVGLRPLEALRKGLQRVRLGEARRLDADLPAELQPLVEETNRLLEAQETILGKARARAGDLAHGLKTPLTALTVLLDRLREQGQGEMADAMEQHLRTLGRHVERELSRARIAADAHLTFRTRLGPAASRIITTMEMLPRGDQIDWRSEVDGELAVPLDEADTMELLGNLFDNARKWAVREVALTGAIVGDAILLAVEDDGPGVPPEELERILQRGIRLDESKPGSGMGLAIALDIVEAYGGSLELAAASIGGLGVKITLPLRK